MSFLQIAVLAIVQGLTEFLPVSSSGHLILVPALTGWPDQGLAIDVASHVGTLLAVVAYFWRDMLAMLAGVGDLARGRVKGGGRLALLLLVGTGPALVVGYLVDKYLVADLRHMEIVAWTMIVFAVVLWAADRFGLKLRRIEHMRFGEALIVGIAQTLAFVPGTSRSGITMVAARLLGYERTEAARFSFLLSVPAIAAAGLWEGYRLVGAADTATIGAAAITLVLSALTGLLAIAVLMRWLRRFGFMPFVIYRLGLGAVLLYLVYGAGY
jgi:undecaprenyl-diphosphatase